MKDTTIEAVYIKSINGTDEIIDDSKLKVTFLGRSNVGKSSLINSLVGKPLARSSSRPGKTVKLDFFLVDRRLFFVDLPGYGYARRSKESLEHYRKLIAWYLFRSGVNHKIAVLIIDAKVGLTNYDRESIALLTGNHIPFVIVANKMDKLSMSERPKQVAQIRRDCGVIPVIVYSSRTLEGKDELLSRVTQL